MTPDDTPKPKKPPAGFVPLWKDEMATAKFRRLGGAAFKLYAVLLGMMPDLDDEAVRHGACAYIAARLGRKKCNVIQQMKALITEELAVYTFKVKGRMTYAQIEAGKFSQLKLFDFFGNPLSVRNRTARDSESNPQGFESDPKTRTKSKIKEQQQENEELNPPSTGHEFGGIGRQSNPAATDDRPAAYAYLRSLKFNHRAAEELSEMNSLSAIQAKYAEGTAINQRRPGTIRNLLGWLREELREMGRVKMGLSKRTPIPQNRTAAPVHGATSLSQGVRVGGGGKRPANRPGGASAAADSSENRPFTKNELATLRQRAASARLGGAATALKEILP